MKASKAPYLQQPQPSNHLFVEVLPAVLGNNVCGDTPLGLASPVGVPHLVSFTSASFLVCTPSKQWSISLTLVPDSEEMLLGLPFPAHAQ